MLININMQHKFILFFVVGAVAVLGSYVVDKREGYKPNLNFQQQITLPKSIDNNHSPPVNDPEGANCQVYVPREMRIYNKSGSQCVWCTIEMLGKLHGVKGVSGLTDEYKHATGPGEVNRVLTQRGVKFKQVTGKDYDFIKEWVADKKMGVGIGVNGNHVILLCHYEENKLVKIIDNADKSLKIQTWDWNKFTKRFDGWAFVILPDQYHIPTDWDNNCDNGKLYR
jgi:hypothetical protein